MDSQYLKKKKKKRKREEEKVYSRLSQNRERGFLREREREHGLEVENVFEFSKTNVAG